jgi:hypothetical protein
VSTGALVRAVREAASDALVSDAALGNMLRITELVPPLQGGVSLECHLGHGVERTDLLVRAMHSDAKTLATVDAPELAQARRFSAWWSAAPGADRVRYVDLEFDMDGASRGCFVGPMIEPTLPAGMTAVMEAMRPEGAANSRFQFALQVLEAPDHEPFAGCPEPALRRCFDALPPGGFIGHAGSLRSRTPDGSPLVRLIASLRRNDLGDYLRSIEWPGSVADLEDAAARYLGAAGRIDLDLDVKSFGLAPDAGFCRAFWDGGLVPAPLHECLDRMGAAGLVTREQAAGVARFAASSLWAAGLSRTLTVKIKLAGDGSRSAKVYLSMLRMG